MSWRDPLELFGDIVTIMAAIVYANHLMERGLPLGALFVVFLGLVVCFSLYTLLPKQKEEPGNQPTGNKLRPLHRILLMLSVFVLIIMDLMVKGIFNAYIREGMPMRVWPPSIYLINEKQCFNDLLSHLTVPIGLLG
jgi:archaellum biogenesis protein FlaJ (TadC family)